MSDQKKLQPIHIRIKNFQSIEDIELEVRGFTCITGPTNIGKSAIMRSISSAILNKPVGNAVRNGASFCSVEIRSESGWGFLWEKGERGVNRCTIGDKVFDKIGRAQLDEVQNMGFQSIDLGEKEAHPWWAKQFFPLFLIDETGNSVTNFISKVSRLTVLQNAISMSAKGKLRANDAAKGKAEQAQKIRDRLTKVSGLDQVVRLRQELQEQADSIRDYENRILTGQKFFDTITTSAKKIEAFKDVEKIKVPEDTFAADVAKLVEMNSHFRKCEGFAKKIIVIRDVGKVVIPDAPTEEFERYKQVCKFEGIDRLRQSVEVMQDVSKVKVPNKEPVEKAARDLNEVVEFERRLVALARTVKAVSKPIPDPGEVPDVSDIKKMQAMNVQMVRLKNEILQLEQQEKKLVEELKDLDARLAEIPTCDNCGRPTSAGDPHVHREAHAHLS